MKQKEEKTETGRRGFLRTVGKAAVAAAAAAVGARGIGAQETSATTDTAMMRFAIRFFSPQFGKVRVSSILHRHPSADRYDNRYESGKPTIPSITTLRSS